MRLIAYYRVSTQRQGRSGLGLEAQRVAVESYAAATGAIILASFTEVESGRRCDRPELAAAVAQARAARATLIVAKLDRLARDAKFLLGLLDAGVAVQFCDLPDIATSDPITGRLLLTVMAAVAEFEARRISQRIREAAAVRKARGDVMGWRSTKGGKNPLTDQHRRSGSERARQVNRDLALDFRAGLRPVAQRLRGEGRTLAETAAELNRLGYTTRKGKPWTGWWLSAFLRPLPGE